jgi:hypothetical protein
VSIELGLSLGVVQRLLRILQLDDHKRVVGHPIAGLPVAVLAVVGRVEEDNVRGFSP